MKQAALSIENGWHLYLEKHFGDKITGREKLEIARYYTRLELIPPKFEATREGNQARTRMQGHRSRL